MRKDRVRVLLVEDSPSDARLLCESLRDYPLQEFAIERAERLEEAVALLACKSFDVILLDLNLPDSSGMETCQRISRAAGPAPIIVLTGADDEVIAAEAMSLGVQDYLVKGQIHGGVIGRTIRYAVERSQSQRALRESERQFKSTFENAAIGIAHVALDGHILQFNSRFCDIAGHLPDDILGKTCEEITLADDWETERVQMQHLLEGQVEHYSIEKRYIRMDGSPVWVNLTRSIQRDEADRPEYFIVIVEDISERKRAEKELRQSEQRYRKLFEANLAGVYLTKPDGTILDFNDAMMRMLRYDSREEMFQHRSSEFYADPEFRKELMRLLQRDGVVPAKEAVLQRKDGSILYALGSAVLLVNEQTGEPYIQGVAIDISERNRAEEALRELTRTLESKVTQRTAELEHRARQLQKLAMELSQAEDRERKRLAEVLHDDLQQQLAASKFHLSLLGNRVKGDASLRGALSSVEEMIKDAIDKSRSLSHELSPAVLYHGDFGEALEWLAGQVHAKHGLVVHVEIRSAIEVSSDPIKAFLFRAAQEILFNIVKHAQVTEAVVRLRRQRGQLWLGVCDRGRGFDPNTLGQTAGFGLLSIRERVELLGGRMKIRSAPCRGSTFLIAVPDSQMKDHEEQRTENRFDPSSVIRPPFSNRILRVLLADDHKVVREGLAALLNEQGDIEVVGQATNGREAVDLAYELRPDVIVMDVAMPLMDGDEATRQIKQHMPGTRVVGLSMFEEPGLVERMRRAGAKRYVVKTAPAGELLAAIRDE